MNLKTILAALGVLALLSGCATGNHGVADDGGAGDDGALVVYSAYAVNADFNRRDFQRPEYSNYTIYQADGRLRQTVRNNSGTALQDPKLVKLPAGKYSIVARVNGHGLVTLPVAVEPRRKTVLHLDGGTSPAGAEAVRSADGQVIGWQTAADF